MNRGSDIHNTTVSSSRPIEVIQFATVSGQNKEQPHSVITPFEDVAARAVYGVVSVAGVDVFDVFLLSRLPRSVSVRNFFSPLVS